MMLRRSALLILTVLLCGCEFRTVLEPGSVTVTGGPADWLVVVYMAADNELESAAIRDLNEMEAANLTGSGVTVACLLDRADGFDASNGDWTGTRAYEVLHDPGGVDSNVISLPLETAHVAMNGNSELNLASPDTLKAFIGDMKQRYQPEHTALIVWGQSAGYRGICFDDSSGDSMRVAELDRALGGEGLDIVAFDTSYSTCIELAWQIRNCARFMVGSQDLAPLSGWNYQDFLDRFLTSSRTAEVFCRIAVESYRSGNEEYAAATISAIDLPALGDVHSALDALSEALSESISSPTEQRALRETLFYDVEDFYTTPGDLALDLGSLAEVTGMSDNGVADEAATLGEAVERCVVAQWANPALNPRACGLSVHYIPLTADGSAATAHDASYFRGAELMPGLDFVDSSLWVPVLPDGPGLLHRLFYEVVE